MSGSLLGFDYVNGQFESIRHARPVLDGFRCVDPATNQRHCHAGELVSEQGVDRSVTFGALRPLHADKWPPGVAITAVQVMAAQARGQAGHDEWPADSV